MHAVPRPFRLALIALSLAASSPALALGMFRGAGGHEYSQGMGADGKEHVYERTPTGYKETTWGKAMGAPHPKTGQQLRWDRQQLAKKKTSRMSALAAQRFLSRR